MYLLLLLLFLVSFIRVNVFCDRLSSLHFVNPDFKGAIQNIDDYYDVF